MYNSMVNSAGAILNEYGVWFTYVFTDYALKTDKGYTNVLLHMSDGSTRDALLLKTVVWVVIDEDENGLVLEKWKIKRQEQHSKS